MSLFKGCDSDCKEEKAWLRERIAQLEQMLAISRNPASAFALAHSAGPAKANVDPPGFITDTEGFRSHEPMEFPTPIAVPPPFGLVSEEETTGAPPQGYAAIRMEMERGR